MDIKRGDVFLVELDGQVGSEQKGVRPVVVVQNDVGNKYSPNIMVAAITSSQIKKYMPTHVSLSQEQYGLPRQSTILCESIHTISKDRLTGKKFFSLNDMDSIRLDRAIGISLGLVSARKNTTRKYA